MKKLFDYLAKLPVPVIPGIARDKVLHMIYGLLVYAVFLGLFLTFKGLSINSVLSALMLTFIIACTKEAVDWYTRTGTVDGADIGATVFIPTILSIIILLVNAVI